MPDILAGMRLALTIALIVAVVGEMIASQSGLGQAILLAARAFRASDLFAGIVLLEHGAATPPRHAITRTGFPLGYEMSKQTFRRAPVAHAVAIALAMAGLAGNAQAQRAFSAAWMAQKNVAQGTAAATGYLPNGTPASLLTNPLAQQQKANEQLQRSIGNLNLAAQAIAAQQ
eukprot:gene3262-4292_t